VLMFWLLCWLLSIFFSSVTRVTGAKNYWADCKNVWFFLSLTFSAMRYFKFQYDPHSNLKDVSQRSIAKLWGPVKNGRRILFLDIFNETLLICVDGHEKIITRARLFKINFVTRLALVYLGVKSFS
jgi:hypothetical protein